MASDFQRRMNVRADTLRKRVDDTVKGAARVVASKLITTTPVLTGLARSNWQASINAPPPTFVLLPISPAEAFTRANVAISKFTAGATIYISNSVHYILKLNFGSSRQAPAGFVNRAAAAGHAIIRRARLLDG